MSLDLTARPATALLALAVAAVAAVAVPLQAQTAADSASGLETPAPAPGMQMFGRADADGDGSVTADEWQAFIAGRAAMTPEQRQAERARTRAEQMIARLDTDGDALLSVDELAAAPMLSGAGDDRRGMGRGMDRGMDRGGRDGMRGHGRMGEDRGGHGRGGDDRRWGRGDHGDSWGRGQMFGMREAPAGMPDAASIFARIDADSDGLVSMEELNAALETMRARGPMGFFGGTR